MHKYKLLLKYFSFDLLLVFFLALILRLYNLGGLPATIYQDEMLVGYIGRFILENGRDINGNHWPLLYFNKFNDYYIILPMYLSGLSTYLFGITEFAIRFPAALFGSIAVFPVFSLANLLTNKRIIGIFSSLMIAISPWHLVLSRSSTESIIELTLIIFGLLLFIQSIMSQSKHKLLVASLIFGSSYIVYHTARLYIPAMILVAMLAYGKNLKKNKFLAPTLIVLAAFSLISLYIISTPWGSGRLSQTSIFSQQSGVMIRLNQLTYNLGENHILMARVFHNKLIGYTREFISQYLTYFSTQFLFIDGWRESRYWVPEIGPNYLVTLIVLIIAVFPISKKIKYSNKILFILFLILFLAPIPASLTFLESPNLRRTVLMTIPLAILTAVGLYKSTQITFNKINLLVPITILLSFETIYFLHLYTKQSDLYSSIYRTDGFPEAAQYMLKNKDKDQIYISYAGTMPLFYLFYKQDFDSKYIGQFQHDVYIQNIDNVFFTKEDCPSQVFENTDLTGNIILINSPNCNFDNSIYEKIDQISGTNPLLSFNVLRKKK